MKQKFYVVWNGVNPGIYYSWTDCLLQIKGFKGALYKSYGSLEDAKQAFIASPYKQFKRENIDSNAPLSQYIIDSIAVDASCSGNPGKMEYRGVYLKTGQEIFHFGPIDFGTNNIGEFLAIVHGLALLKKKESAIPVYSDSRNAIKWIQQKKCNTNLKQTALNAPLFNIIERAEKWLQTNEFASSVLKWETSCWGEIPADFGRK